MKQKNTYFFLREIMSYILLLIIPMSICSANHHGLELVDSNMSSNNKFFAAAETDQFTSGSNMDLPEVMTHVYHYGCQGQLGTITVYSPDGVSLDSLDISLDGGVTFLRMLKDNFQNLVLLNVTAGEYELVLRRANDEDIDNHRYIGVVEVLVASAVDLDEDGFSTCDDVNDNDPCLPQDCDISSGKGCDLSLDTIDYEWCHFEDITNPQVISIGMSTEDAEGHISYLWSTGDTTSRLEVSPQSDTYYRVTVSDQTGCILEDSVHVQVLFTPDIDVHVIHKNCKGDVGSIVLFSPVREEIDQIDVSIDGGSTFQPATQDNFGNVILYGLDLGEYAISIRHKDHKHCVKDLGVYSVEDEQLFDEDEDGVLKCQDIDDTDECAPHACENCDEVSKDSFESDNNSWSTDSRNIERSTEQAYTGTHSVKLSNTESYIESQLLKLDKQKSFNINVAAYPDNLEKGEAVILSASTDGGQTFIDLKRWISLIDFHNNEWIQLSHQATIEDGIDELMFRLRLSSSAFSDYVYLDDIKLEFCEIEYSPTETEACEIINYDDVDAFLSFWTFGGEDAMLSTIHPASGQFSYHIKNGNGEASSLISSSFSTSGVGHMTVNFDYTPISMEPKEFFSLELSLDEGITYKPIKSWISGEFENEQQYSESVHIPLNRSIDNINLRFTNYGNSQYDHVYLDNIKIEYCEDVSKRSEQQDAEVNIEFEKGKSVDSEPQSNLGSTDSTLSLEQTTTVTEIALYPNPTTDYITLALDTNEAKSTRLFYRITELTGQTILFNQLEKRGKTQIDVSRLRAGMYVIQVYDDTEMYLNQKLIKI